jgi:hypothetical protein
MRAKSNIRTCHIKSWPQLLHVQRLYSVKDMPGCALHIVTIPAERIAPLRIPDVLGLISAQRAGFLTKVSVFFHSLSKQGPLWTLRLGQDSDFSYSSSSFFLIFLSLFFIHCSSHSTLCYLRYWGPLSKSKTNQVMAHIRHVYCSECPGLHPSLCNLIKKLRILKRVSLRPPPLWKCVSNIPEDHGQCYIRGVWKNFLTFSWPAA